MTALSSLLIVVVLALVQVAYARLATPPAYFNRQDAIANVHAGAERGKTVTLGAPRHSSNVPDAEQAHDIVRRSQQRALLRRQSQPQSNTSQSSANNSNDKSQSLGFLGDSYYVPLNVSSQMLFVSVDTGSSDLWFVSTSCTTAQCDDDRILKFNQDASQSYHPLQVSTSANVSVVSPSNITHSGSSGSNTKRRYSHSERTEVTGPQLESMHMRKVDLRLAATIQDDTTSTVPFSLQYGDTTTATGILGVDSVALADEVVSSQVFGLVSSTNVSLAQQGISGVLGLGFARGSAIARSLLGQDLKGALASPLLSSILATKKESYPLFTLLLTRTSGRMTLGAADATILTNSKSRGQVEWHDVVPFPSGNTAAPSNATNNLDGPSLGQYVFWALPLTAAGFNGTSVQIRPTYRQVGTNAIALIDSGTAGILGPLAAVSSMFAQIEGARHVGNGRYVVPCTTQQRMFFSFGGRDYTLLPSDYIIGPASGNSYLCFAWPAAVPGSADGVDWILGQAFLRSVYSLFSLGIAEREAPKIGFYPLNNDADVTATASLFALQPSADVASFVSQATPILTTLPNSLIPLTTPTSQTSYFFSNATTTAALGFAPTSNSALLAAVPPATYRPLLTASTGNDDLPVLASGSSALPLPSNPASDPSNAATSLRRASDGNAGQQLFMLFLSIASILLFTLL